MGGKKLEQTQRRLCVLVTGSAKKGFSWKTVRGCSEGEGELRECFGGTERCELLRQRERSLLRFAGVPHCGSSTGHSLAPLHSDHKEGISSFIYSISCHVDPKMAPVPSPKLHWPSQSSPRKERPLMGALFLACCSFLWVRRGRELADLRAHTETSWICGSGIEDSVGVGTTAN